MKKFLCLLMSLVILMSVSVTAFASVNSAEANELNKKFTDGVGPAVDGLAIDYAAYAPEKIDADTQYPLLILIHGMGQGAYPRKQLEDNNFSMFASDDLQARFTNGAAYVFVPRSDESDSSTTWGDDETAPLYAAIKDYIAKNSANIDLSRIYIGGYSMGGKMTIKMLTSYPDLFAAAFPMCPALAPSEAQIKAMADKPVWLMCSRFDILAGYYVYGQDIWEGLCDVTTMPTDCRISVFGKVCYADGTKTTSNHHIWFAACNDLFTYDGGDYPNMVTYDASGAKVKLTSPDGLISWLCSYTSDYHGQDLVKAEFTYEGGSTLTMVTRMLSAIGAMFKDTLTSAFKMIIK